MRYCGILFFILLFALPVFAQAKHPLTFEDMMKLKRVEEPQVSPDGKWVLFAAVDVDFAANTKTPHVWIVPTAGGQEKEIIADQDADRPRWAPDGKRFAFISTKEDGSQIWVADFDSAIGTVPSKHRVTYIAIEADGELWSPDGKNILFKSDVYPECDGTPEHEEDCNAKALEVRNKSKVKALVFTHLLYRHWDAYKEGKRSHIFQIPAPDTLCPTEQNSTNLGCTVRAFVVVPTVYRDLTPDDYDAPVFRSAARMITPFLPMVKRFATPRTTIRCPRILPTMICLLFR